VLELSRQYFMGKMDHLMTKVTDGTIDLGLFMKFTFPTFEAQTFPSSEEHEDHPSDLSAY